LSAFGANLLQLKPCIEVIDGKMKPGKKYRGNISRVIANYVVDRLQNRDDINKHRIFITHTKCNQEDIDEVRNKIIEICPDFEEIIETTAGCTVTTHCGPATLGILFIRK
ncbi:MAG: DegV family protein, partial [Ruminococcus sp.]|nr:DegV family protein [Ruminococcus sp.]